MQSKIERVIEKWLDYEHNFAEIIFATRSRALSTLNDQQPLPELYLLIEGNLELKSTINGQELTQKKLSPSTLVFCPNKHQYELNQLSPATLLHIVFDKQTVSFKFLESDGKTLCVNEHHTQARRGPRVGAFIINALSEATCENGFLANSLTGYHLIRSLMSHLLDLFKLELKVNSKTGHLYDEIRQYIDANYKKNVTREQIANQFYISPNYLSYLFHKEGKIRLNAYLTNLRLEYAKSLLKGHSLTIKQIADVSGFNDCNYFCRLFKKKTERSPTQYRQHYHSVK